MRNKPVRFCRTCGCDDNHACITDHGPCAWIVVDIETPTGVCSACAVECDWDQDAFAFAGREQETLLRAMRPGLVLP